MSAVSLFGSLAVLGYVSTQGYYEDQRHLVYPSILHNIPKQFEIREKPSSSSVKEFEKYAKQIQNLAKKENATVIYKIQVELLKTFNPKGTKKYNKQKTKPKTYNIPLKKNVMKLSNFEVFLRKAAEENSRFQQVGASESLMTSTRVPHISSKAPHFKFKPIKSELHNFAKVIRPVKNNIITLS